MRRFISVALCAAFVTGNLAGTSYGSGLEQISPVRKASQINSAGDFNEYPWFSHDGKLMFWTRQEGGNGHPQELLVGYIKNWAAIANKPAGQTLPVLQMDTYTKFDDIDGWINGHFPPGNELRASAVCTKPADRAPVSTPNKWVYKFSLYFSVRVPNGGAPPGQLWRTQDIAVEVNKSTFQTSIVNPITTFTEVAPPVGSTFNETEPFFSRDSRFFFWGSNKWTGGNVAEYIGPASQCTQALQTPKSYLTLPSSGPGDYFAWRDQYNLTSRTNYHALATMRTGRTLLIFEECHGRTVGDPRDTWCTTNNDKLSTTGLTANGQPSNIDDSGFGGAAKIHPTASSRATHPAISGPQLSDGSWLLFYMQGKKIYYTRVKAN